MDVNSSIELDRSELSVPQPKCCELYYESCAKIDQHNRSRTDILKINKKDNKVMELVLSRN